MLINQFLSSNAFTPVNKLTARMLGFLVAGFLGEMIRQRERFGKEEFYFTQNDMEEQTGMSAFEQRGCIKKLLDEGIITVIRKGTPYRNFYTIDDEALIKKLQDYWGRNCTINGEESDALMVQFVDNINKKTNKKTNNNLNNKLLIFNHWNTKKLTVHEKLDIETDKQINARLQEFTVEQILTAIDNYANVYHHKDTYFKQKRTLAEFLQRAKGMRVFLYKSPADYAAFGKTIVIHNRNSKAYIISLLDKLVDDTKGLSVNDHFDALRKILDEHGLSSWDVYCFNVVRSNYRDWKNGVSAAKPDIPLSRIVYDWETLKIARKPGRAFSDNNGSLPCDTLDKEGFIYKLFIDAGDTRKC